MKKFISTTIAVSIFTAINVSPVFADVSLTALPTLSHSTNENINVPLTGGGSLNVNVNNQPAGVMITNAGSTGLSHVAPVETAKVILIKINPNDVIFGTGANVNPNSITVSTLDGTQYKENNKLILTKGSNQGDYGILVENGASIYNDKNVTFASNNIDLYSSSKISTNTVENSATDSNGKIKLVTADGVNFTYDNNSEVKNVSDVKASTGKMTLPVNGDLTAGNTNENSEITLKAINAVKGDDGNIWLTASNKIVLDDASLTTENL